MDMSQFDYPEEQQGTKINFNLDYIELYHSAKLREITGHNKTPFLY
jgi:hypothetical protein